MSVPQRKLLGRIEIEDVQRMLLQPGLDLGYVLVERLVLDNGRHNVTDCVIDTTAGRSDLVLDLEAIDGRSFKNIKHLVNIYPQMRLCQEAEFL